MAAVTANSLSAINNLASNPPQYPRNPSHQAREPVTLYIARVPGSRDVFLSPLKPREKVVTAEDISNCLYFLHVERPEDEKLRSEIANAVISEESPTHSPSVRRKELPLAPNSFSNQSPITSTASHPQRKALPSVPTGSHGPLHGAEQHEANDVFGMSRAKVPSRKPLDSPSREVHSQRADVFPQNITIARKAIGKENTPLAQQAPAAQSNPFGYAEPQHIRKLDTSFSTDVDYNLPPIPPPHRPAAQAVQPLTETPTTTTLTLIRRNPVSGDQWNVARISDPPVYEVTSSSLEARRKQQGAPIYLEISNTGYSRFLHAVPDIPTLQSRAGLDSSLSSPSGQSSSQQPGDTSATDGLFRRRLWMENSRQSAHHRMRSDFSMKSYRSSSAEKKPSGSWTGHDEPESPARSSIDSQRITAIPGTEKRSSYARGYAFMSPWNGRCEFVTGLSGNSLKCKHSLPTVASGAGDVSPPVVVSDLRFNLPGSSSSKSSESSSKLHSFLGRPRARSHVASLSADSRTGDEDTGLSRSLNRLDLSLGQESAGGGFGGKRAKLGKLVIEDEGLKMMDLVVAANMALWWRAYEKVAGLE